MNDSKEDRKRVKRREHVRSEPGPLEMKCDFCGKILKTRDYVSHLRDLHPGQKGELVKKCPWCEKIISYGNGKSYGIEVHITRMHYWGRFKCKICKFIASFTKDLVGHIEHNHRDCLDADCPRCQKEFPVNELESHYRECLAQKFKEWSRKQKTVKVCETCGKKFTSLNGYRNLKKAHIRERLASGEEGLDASNLLFHCDKCGMVLKSKWALKYHMQSEHEKGMITCSECNLTFHTKKTFLTT